MTPRIFVRSLRDVLIVFGLDLYDAIPRKRTCRQILSADEDHWNDGTD